MVVYGAMAGISVGSMFLAGVIPGIMIGVAEVGVAYVISRKRNFRSEAAMTWAERFEAGRKASLTLVIPIMIIGGIVIGFFTPTEAAAFVVVFALFLSLFVYRSLSWKDIPKALLESAAMSALPCFTVACAAIFGWLFAYFRVPDFVGTQILAVSSNPLVIVGILIIFLLILGTFLSEIATIIIFIPIFLKIGEIARLDPIHLGMVVILLLCFGLVLPPHGICLLISCGIGKVDVLEGFKDCFWFAMAYLFVVVLVVLFPALSLWLPRLLMPQFA
jgi:tripartite ATP-independent transporter DctM subunit